MFCSASLGILVRDGKLSWTDKISQHFPNFDPVGDREIGRNANLIDACQHSTGLGNPNTLVYGPECTLINTDSDHVELMNNAPTSNASGQRFRSWWIYSNQAYGLMSNVIEAASGSRYSDFLRDYLFKPLGMSQSLVSRDQVSSNDNVAHPYVKLSSGDWIRLTPEWPDENHGPSLAVVCARSSVTDMLTFCDAVLENHEVETTDGAGMAENTYQKGQRAPSQAPAPSPGRRNPIKEMGTIWYRWWTRPVDDHFDNKTAYCLGWYRTTMPTGALGLLSYSFLTRLDQDKTYLKSILGKDSKPRLVYGNNGVNNGGLSTVYVFPETKSAVVVLCNGADVGDAGDVVSQLLVQALFDLKPHVDLLPRLTKDIKLRYKHFEGMIADWRRNRDTSHPERSRSDYTGKYLGMGTSRISIEEREGSLAVIFAEKEVTRFTLEHYNKDAYSFFPLERDTWLRRGMIDWDDYRVGLFFFVRNEKDLVTGLKWQWDANEEPTLYVKLV